MMKLLNQYSIIFDNEMVRLGADYADQAEHMARILEPKGYEACCKWGQLIMQFGGNEEVGERPHGS